MKLLKTKIQPRTQLLETLLNRKRALENEILRAIQGFELETGAAVISVTIPKLLALHDEMGFTQKISVRLEV